jgi:hypothetical protein
VDINDLPVVGQTHRVFEFVCSVTVRCECQQGNDPMTIILGAAKGCTLCGRIYGVTAFDFVMGQRAPRCSVGVLGQLPAEQLLQRSSLAVL